MSRKLKYIPLVLTKVESTSDTFLQVFLITIYLIIIENWIVTLLVKITCNFIKKMYNMKLIVTVPYVKIFFNNFLHFSNSCDVKLKSILIDCSVFVSLGSDFMHLPEYFLVVVIIFTWLMILSLFKKWWKQLFCDCYQVNLKIFLPNLPSDKWYREPTLAHGVQCLQHSLSCSCHETQLITVRVS